MKIKKILLIIFILFFKVSFSHPHIFFETNIKLKVDKKLEGIEIHHILDKLNSKINKKIFKADKEMNIDSDNIVFLNDLYKHIKISYKNKNYGRDDIIFEQAKLVDDQLEIWLFLPIDEEITKGDKLKISFYDKKYYYTYSYDKSSFSVDYLQEPRKYNLKFFTNKNISFYFKLINPEEYEVTFE